MWELVLIFMIKVSSVSGSEYGFLFRGALY